MLNSQRFTISIRLAVISMISLLGGPASGQAGTYTDSAHGGSNSSPSHFAGQGVLRPGLSGKFAAGNCAHCHEQHASIDGSEPSPVKPGPSNYLLFDALAGDVMCIYCHNGSKTNGADNIADQIIKTTKHDPNSTKGSVLCNDCHNSHVAKNTSHSEAVDGNSVSGALLSVKGVVVGSWPIPGTPGAGSDGNLVLGTPNPTPVDPITMEYQLCFKCHNGEAPYSSLPDLRGQFNPNNYSVHPVTTNGTAWKKNQFYSLNPTALKTPWSSNIDAQMYCSDCHGSNNSTDPVGPHGSSNINMLKLYGPGTTLDNLCNKCHNVSVSAWVEGPLNPDATKQGDHSLPEHQYPINNMGCMACHGGIGGPLVSNIHGANYLWASFGGYPGRPSTEFLVGGLITQNYYIGSDVRGNRYCAASCHAGGVAYSY